MSLPTGVRRFRATTFTTPVAGSTRPRSCCSSPPCASRASRSTEPLGRQRAKDDPDVARDRRGSPFLRARRCPARSRALGRPAQRIDFRAVAQRAGSRSVLGSQLHFLLSSSFCLLRLPSKVLFMTPHLFRFLNSATRAALRLGDEQHAAKAAFRGASCSCRTRSCGLVP